MYKVIIVDDEAKVRNSINRLADWEKHVMCVCDQAENGEELLQKIEQQEPSLIITDMKMPGISGSQLMEVLEEKYPRLPFIVVSGFDDFQYVRAALLTRAVDYLLKPIDPVKLDGALARARQLLDDASANEIRELTVETLSGPVNLTLAALKQRNRSVYNMVCYIMENSADRITLQQLSEHFFWSEEYISKKFKEEIGCGLFDFITAYKIKEAKRWLLQQEKLLAIANRFGFTDESHFSKTFKRYTGMTPSEYKNSPQKDML